MGAVVAMILGALAVVAWLSTFVHVFLLMPHRRDDISLGTLFFSGWRFYSPETWKPSGHALYRRFVGSALAFFVAIAMAFAVGALTAAR